MIGDEDQERRRFEVRGVVQGVGFRMWALRHARRLGLRGTVRNRDDGAVELEAAGATADLDTLERLLADGPQQAHVSAVRRLAPGSTPLPDSFEVSHEF